VIGRGIDPSTNEVLVPAGTLRPGVPHGLKGVLEIVRGDLGCWQVAIDPDDRGVEVAGRAAEIAEVGARDGPAGLVLAGRVEREGCGSGRWRGGAARGGAGGLQLAGGQFAGYYGAGDVG